MDDVLVAEYRLGMEAELFWKSELGRAMEALAAQDRQIALEGLAYISPLETRAIQKLQNDVKVAEMFTGYVSELITRSYEAEAAIKQGN